MSHSGVLKTREILEKCDSVSNMSAKHSDITFKTRQNICNICRLFFFPFWIILVEIKSCLLKNDRKSAMTQSYAAVMANYPQICSPEHLRQLGKARPTYNSITTQQLHLHECRDISKPFSSPQNPQRKLELYLCWQAG